MELRVRTSYMNGGWGRKEEGKCSIHSIDYSLLYKTNVFLNIFTTKWFKLFLKLFSKALKPA
jgi:hypothetical protein